MSLKIARQENTPEPQSYTFAGRCKMSGGVADGADIKSILLREIPGAIEIEKANLPDDKKGTDYWVLCEGGEKFRVDLKARGEDCIRAWGTDDLALETWSVIEKEKIGWTRDTRKHTDYIMWLWKDTGRWCLVPFRMLCAVYSDKWEQWRDEYKTRRQITQDFIPPYHSECTFVPRRLVWKEIYQRFSGQPA